MSRSLGVFVALIACLLVGCREEEIAISGTYDLESRVVLPHASIDNGGGMVAFFADVTDDTQDPARWVLDRMQDRMNGPLAGLFAAGRAASGADAKLQQVILTRAPQVLGNIVEIGRAFDQLGRDLRLSSELTVGEDGRATHAVVTIAYTLDGERRPYALGELGLPAMVAGDVSLEGIGDGRVAVADHGFALAYGKLVAQGVQRIILDRRGHGPVELADWLTSEIGCDAVGQELADEIGYGSANFYARACSDALDGVVAQALQPLAKIGGELSIGGSVQLVDDDGDGVADHLVNGSWAGRLALDGDGHELVLEAQSSFAGARRP